MICLKRTGLAVLIACSLVLSGCGLFSNKENTKEPNTEAVSETEVELSEVESTEVELTEMESTEITMTESETMSTPQDMSTSGQSQETAGQLQTTPEQSQQTPEQPQKTPEQSNQTSEQPQQRYVVDVITERVETGTETYKYGITIHKAMDKTYEIYNDGSRVCVAEYSADSYDCGTYHATDAEIQGESDANCQTYMGYYQEVLTLVNQIRAEAGVAPLTLDTNLCRAASMRSLEMDYGNYFEHRRADGRDCFSVMGFYGCSFMTAGENIAAGQRTPAEVVEGWKNSPGHYANMINADFTRLGVGYSYSGMGDYGHYWTQLFSD